MAIIPIDAANFRAKLRIGALGIGRPIRYDVARTRDCSPPRKSECQQNILIASAALRAIQIIRRDTLIAALVGLVDGQPLLGEVE